MNLRIREIVIFNQTTKIDTHEEKYFHSIRNKSNVVLFFFEKEIILLQFN
jgi:hypothetical protein